mmetsp:Transcript_31148/g.47635  ORF Transcript_31148/g.47635 Transcript_31148/m.47635 type:complete len:90 (+) Transcript_31148:1870-2139(+)
MDKETTLSKLVDDVIDFIELLNDAVLKYYNYSKRQDAPFQKSPGSEVLCRSKQEVIKDICRKCVLNKTVTTATRDRVDREFGEQVQEFD